jgi:membrane fusion protein (multidrug efflux system)
MDRIEDSRDGAAPDDGNITYADDRPARAEEVRPREKDAPRPRQKPDDDDHQTKEGDAKGDAPKDDAKDGSKDKGGDKKADEKKRRSPLLWIILLVVLVVGAIAGTLWWLSTRNLEDTDDAYTDGRQVAISPKVSGYVVNLAVNDNQRLRAGDLIAQIDPRDYVTARDQARANLDIARAQELSAQAGAAIARKNFPAKLAQAQAQLDQARAQLFQAQTDYKRQHSVARAATTQQSVDQSTAALHSAEAQVEAAQANVVAAQPVQENIDQSTQRVSQVQGQVDQAQAQLAQAELNLSNTRILAPQDGWVTKRNIEKGNYLAAGTQIMFLVSPDVWVTANFKETQLNRIRPGQVVDITVDAYPGLKLKGHVDSVQLGSGSKFSAFPAENATGNYIKIVQRVPVKVDIDSGLDPTLPLPLGLSVEPTVHLQ